LGLGAFGAAAAGAGDLAYQEYENYQNGSSYSNINTSELGTAAAGGFAAGFLAPFAPSAIGAAGIGELTNIGQYLYSNGSSSTLSGASWAGLTGALGGAAGGSFANPYKFFNPGPFPSGGYALGQNVGLGNFLRQLLGGFLGAINPPTRPSGK